MRWRQDDLNGKYTEVANDDVEAFLQVCVPEFPAGDGFSAAGKIVNRIDGLMNGDMEAWQVREIKDRSPAFSKVLGIGCRYTDDTGRQSSPGKLQTALPSNAGL